MATAPGSRIGIYEIVAPLGAGGMGEVYRGRDTKLNREVAVKILPAFLARDPERVARFEREARVLAALNHPNIAQIYGVEDSKTPDSEHTRALVMELVPGETLAAKIKNVSGQPTPLPLEEAIQIGIQIAEALEAAHEKNIIHRDLKPANILVTPETAGARSIVKVLDFGLATMAQESAAAPSSPGMSPTMLPTMSMSPTRSGVIMGTAAYMSPEQARGHEVDRRTDIWAFGCVLYEMLTGAQPFTGDTVLDILSSVLNKEPDLNAVPGSVRRLISRCLTKDRRARLQAIGEARIALDQIRTGNSELASSDASAAAPGSVAPSATPSPSRIPLAWAGWGVTALLLVGSGIAYFRTPSAPPKMVSKWLEVLEQSQASGVAFSNDGTKMAFADDSGIWVRDAKAGVSTLLRGTAAGGRPFFSPDDQWLAFFEFKNGQGLRKIPVNGGPSQSICPAGFYGGAWASDGTLIFPNANGLAQSVNGTCQNITTTDREKHETHRWPQLLPGEKSILFTIAPEGEFDEAQFAVLDRATRQFKLIGKGGTRAQYVPSGHLVYVRSNTIFAVPFDLGRLQITGGEAPIAENVLYNSSGGFADFAFNREGLMVYSEETREFVKTKLEWRDKRGSVVDQVGPELAYRNVRIAPDGNRVAVSIDRGGGNSDLVVLDLMRGTALNLHAKGVNSNPVWSPAGDQIAFRWSQGQAIGVISADGSGVAKPIVEMYGNPHSWAPDGRSILYAYGSPVKLFTAEVDGKKTSSEEPLLGELGGSTFSGDISRDGKWLVYAAGAEAASSKVYARALQGPGEKIVVSVDRGTLPRWSRDGKEIYFVDPSNGQLMAAKAEQSGANLRVGKPEPLFNVGNSAWDVSPDGKRFLVVKRQENAPASRPSRIHIVVNWFDELKQKAPAKN